MRPRSGFLRTLGLASAYVIQGTPGSASAEPGAAPTLTPEAALSRLMTGNAAFVAGKLQASSAIAERRADVAGSQKPFAMILSCADSRVPPEHVFDQSVGDLFICRVAGNILEPAALGSFEYALSQFGSTAVLVVMGHQRCGAVSDTIKLVKSGGTAPGKIQTIVEAIRPAVEATKQGSMSERDYVEAVVATNAKMVARAIVAQSEILQKAVAAHHLRVVAARYSLDSGKVVLLS